MHDERNSSGGEVTPAVGQKQALITVDAGTPLADTRVIAKHIGVQHVSLYRLITEYHETISEAFGTVRFEIGPSNAKGGGGDGARYALLTEDQATFLITLTRNTAQVIRFKAALVAAFSEAKRQLAERPVIESGLEVQMIELVRKLKKEGASPDAATRAASEIVRSVANRKRKTVQPDIVAEAAPIRPIRRRTMDRLPEAVAGVFNFISGATADLREVRK